MNFYMKQKVFSFRDRFAICDASGRECFYVEGEVFSFGKKLHLYDAAGNEVAFISQKVFSFHPRYDISIGGREVAEVVKEFTFFHPLYSVSLRGGGQWRVDGDFWDHEYRVEEPSRIVADVSKEWFTWGDSYRIAVSSEVDPVLALSVVLVIDACLEANN